MALSLLFSSSTLSRAALISSETEVPPMGDMGDRGSSSISRNLRKSGSRSMSSPGIGVCEKPDSGREKFGGVLFARSPRDREEAILFIGRSLKRGAVYE